MARVVAVGVAHHITQRGINRQAVFTSDKSREVYLSLLREHADRHRLRILGYCLMTNHVHVLAVPDRDDALAATFRYAHGRYAQYANTELRRSGHFWQNRFPSCPVEASATDHVLAYVERNPVRAGMVRQAGAFAWSSAGVHTGAHADDGGTLDLTAWRERWTGAEWAEALAGEQADAEALRRATYTGRPLGSEAFVADLELRLQRKLQRQKGGRPKRNDAAALPGQCAMFG